nr:hypothetical protein [Candidatus Freyarchaeota archaeon]
MLRVGADSRKESGGIRGPFWSEGEYEYDSNYEYVPVTYSWKRAYVNNGKYMRGEKGEKTYGDSNGDRLKRPYSKIIPKRFKTKFEKLKNVTFHYDPNFKYLTYGDRKENIKGKPSTKGMQMANLDPGDLLVFCESLQHYETNDRGLFIIGYFTVEEVHDFTDSRHDNKTCSLQIRSKIKDKPDYYSDRSEVVSKYKDKTDHFSETAARSRDKTREELLEKEKNLVLVKGKELESGLLKKAIRITERRIENGKKSYYYIRKPIAKDLGIEKPIFNIGFKWVKEPYTKNLLSILKEGEGFYVDC